nr:MAG TPA: hypothetical protein [Caudoviricetes sp.]
MWKVMVGRKRGRLFSSYLFYFERVFLPND